MGMFSSSAPDTSSAASGASTGAGAASTAAAASTQSKMTPQQQQALMAMLAQVQSMGKSQAGMPGMQPSTYAQAKTPDAGVFFNPNSR